MSILFKLKQWLTVTEAANHLTIVCGEEVTPADVLRFALDGHLKLSVNFLNSAYAKEYKITPPQECIAELKSKLGENVEIPSEILNRILSGEGQTEEVSSNVITLNGIFDLPMIEGNVFEIEDEYQKLISGPEVTMFSWYGTFVTDCVSLKSYQLQIRFNSDIIAERKKNKNFVREDMFCMAPRLPEDRIIVIRATALRDFEKLLSEMVDQERTSSGGRKGTKVDAMRVEIEDIIQQGTAAKSENIWREMVARCGTKGSCCIAVGEDESGPFIKWRSSKGSFKTLRKNNLAEKLRTRKTG